MQVAVANDPAKSRALELFGLKPRIADGTRAGDINGRDGRPRWCQRDPVKQIETARRKRDCSRGEGVGNTDRDGLRNQVVTAKSLAQQQQAQGQADRALADDGDAFIAGGRHHSVTVGNDQSSGRSWLGG